MDRRVLVLWLLAGCGRLGFTGAGDDPEPGDNMTTGVDDSSPRAPSTCEVRTFATLATANVDLAVATTPTGAAVVWVPTDEGNLVGLSIALDRQASPITKISAGPYTQSAVAYVDGRLIATGRSSGRALIHDVPTPIEAGYELANLWGDQIAKKAILHAGGERVMAVSCGSLALHSFDAAWGGIEDTYGRGTPSGSDHIEVTQLASRAFTAVSIDGGCVYVTSTSGTDGDGRESPVQCKQARLASTGDQVAMVLEADGAIDLVIDDASTVTAANALPIAVGSSPRVLHHDGRYWVSYLDDTGGVVIGYLADGVLLTHRLAIAAPAHDAYELAVYDGAPWLFAVDPQSAVLSGHRLCTPGS